MRRLLGTVLLVAVISGCGDDPGPVTDDPAPTASPAPTKGTNGAPVDFELVETITETAAGGRTGAAAVPLADDLAVAGFTAQFSSEEMTTRVQAAVSKASASEDRLVYAAVVAIGCDSPGDVTVTSGDQGLVVTAQQVADPVLECFAPMTTVAVVLVPASAVS